jgi:phosphate transport system protein
MSVMQREMDNLKKKILGVGTVVEESVAKAVRALLTRNPALAEEVKADDLRIDQMDVEFEEEGLKVLALHQPVAIDLRFIVSALRINSDLERIGDLSVNIAERAAYLAGGKRIDLPLDYAGMAAKTQEMVKKSLDALVRLDTALAREVMATDDEVDAMNRKMYREIQAEMARSPADIQPLMHMLSCSRHLERIADHATNIAEDVIYMVEGEIIRHKTEDFRGSGL